MAAHPIGTKLGQRMKVCNVEGTQGCYKINAQGRHMTNVSAVDLDNGMVSGDEFKVATSRVRNVRTYAEASFANLDIDTEDGADGAGAAASPPRPTPPRRPPAEIVIRIDRESWDRLKALAVPFEDSPASVVRRLLGLDPPLNSDGMSSNGHITS